jgi:hypothetical protein
MLPCLGLPSIRIVLKLSVYKGDPFTFQGGPTRDTETPPDKLPDHTMAVACASLHFMHRMVRQRLSMVQVNVFPVNVFYWSRYETSLELPVLLQINI